MNTGKPLLRTVAITGLLGAIIVTAGGEPVAAWHSDSKRLPSQSGAEQHSPATAAENTVAVLRDDTGVRTELRPASGRAARGGSPGGEANIKPAFCSRRGIAAHAARLATAQVPAGPPVEATALGQSETPELEIVPPGAARDNVVPGPADGISRVFRSGMLDPDSVHFVDKAELADRSTQIGRATGGDDRSCSGTYCEVIWSDIGAHIPDQGWGCLGIDMGYYCDFPSGAYVTGVEVRVRIDDLNGTPGCPDYSFYCGDYKVWVSKGSCYDEVDFYGRCGYRCDSGCDCDDEDDSDVYLSFACSPCLSNFNGETAGDWFYVYVEDQLGGDEGQVDQVGFRVFYEMGSGDPPDLVMEDCSISPTSDVQPGDQMTIESTVRNVGAGATESIFAVQWYISLDSTVNEDDAAWAYYDVYCCLDPGETDTFAGYAPWPDAPPYNTPYTTYWVRAKADAWSEVSESNEGNNWCSTWAVTLGAPPQQYPDLIVSDGSCSPTTDVQPGDGIDLSATVTNQGNADATYPFYVGWYISEDASLSEDDFEWAYAYIPCCLGGGDSTVASGAVPWPSLTPGQTYYIIVMADDTYVVTESNENNNAFISCTIAQDDEPPPENPDLIIQSSYRDPAVGVQPGGPVYLEHVVENQGTAAASWYFYATWYISTDSDMDVYEDDAWAYSYIPCCLQPGETYDGYGTVPWPTYPPYNQPGQTYYIAVMADDTDLVSESNESNNWGTIWTVILGDASGNLSGTVYDASTGDYIAYAEVTLIGESPQYTNTQGEFSFTNVPAGENTLTVTKNGYYDVSEPVVINSDSTTEITIWMTPESAGDNPVVVGVWGDYSGPGTRVYYLDGVWLDETFTATVDWNGQTPGTVEFRTPYGTYQGAGGGGTWTRSFNMGADFGAGGTLTVVAISESLVESTPYVANFKVVSSPPGILPFLIYAEPVGDMLKYVTPNLSEDPTGLSEGVDDVPADMPLFGNEAFEFVSMFEASAQIDARSGSATALNFNPDLPGAEGKTKLAGFEFTPSLSGQLSWQFSENPDRWIPGGSLQIGAQVGADVPPAPVVFMFGPVPCYFRGHIDVGVAVNLSVIGWDAPGQAVFDGTVVLDPFPYAEAMLGAGVADVVAVEGYLGGGARMTLDFPPTPPNPALQELQIYLAGGVRVVVFMFEYEWPFLEYTWEPDLGMHVARYGAPIIGILPRDYLKRPEGYAVFVANQHPRDWLRDVITAESEIELNVFEQSTADLAAIGDNLLAAWVYDDPTRTDLNRTEIVFIRGEYDGTWWTWDDPLAAADDGTADFHPQVATLPDDDVLLVWENVSEVLTEPSDPNDPNEVAAKLEEMKSKTEIATARYDAAAQGWLPQTILTDNAYLDRSPRVATAPDGTAILIWTSNTANEETGSVENPNKLHYATYDGATWSAPADLANNVPSIIKSAAAYDGINAVLVYAADVDDNPDTIHDRELFWTTFDGSAWTPVTQLLAPDAIEDANPQVAYDSTGGLLLVWYRGGRLVMKTDLSPIPPTTVVELQIEASTGLADFRLAIGYEGQIALVWQDASNDRVDLWRAIYSPIPPQWSSAQQLTTDNWMEHGVAPVYTASGDLVAMYDKVDTMIDTRPVDLFGEQVMVDVPMPDRTDLYLLRHQVTGDLAIYSEDLAMYPPDAAVGEVVNITAIVRNLGDVAAHDVEVGFYDGDPDEGGTLIDMPVIAGWLFGGTQAQTSVEWIVPVSPGSHDIYVVADPSQLQEDGNRANNIAVLEGGLRPDLYIDSIVVQEAGPSARIFSVRVGNRSGWPVSNVDVALRREAVDGELLTMLLITDPIAPGTYRDVSWTWQDLPSCVVTTDVYAIVDAAGVIDEYDENNNTNMVIVQVGPPFLLYDMNYDGFVSIIGDVPPFVECIYFGNCPEDPDPVCPGDCSGDGFLSIVGDVPCFVDCVYFGNCGRDRGDGGQSDAPTHFTVGGAVYDDLQDPLASGVAGVKITIKQTGGTFTATATTDGSFGVWRIDGVPTGTYAVIPSLPGTRFDHVEGGHAAGPAPAQLMLSEDAPPEVYQSLQFLARSASGADTSRRADHE